MSHRLQPLDVSVFSLYKHAYRKVLPLRFENHEVGISKQNFYEIVSHAQAEALTEKNIRSRFWPAGIIPSDGETILRQLYEEQAAREEARYPRGSISPTENCSLCNMELTEIAQLHTTRKPAEFEAQARLILDDLSPTSPQSWCQQQIAENIVYCAEYGMTESNLKDERIRALEKETHDLQNKEKTNRKIIPKQDACFLSQADIKSFFAHHESEKQRQHQAEINYLRTSIAAGKTKIHLLSEKLLRNLLLSLLFIALTLDIAYLGFP